MDNAFSYLTRVMNTYIIECTFNFNMQRATTPPTLTVSAYQSRFYVRILLLCMNV